MALINCPECNKEISDKAASCPNCGYPIAKDESDKSKSIYNFNGQQYDVSQIQWLVEQGQIIQAIKEFRVLTGAGLAEAKNAVDRMPRVSPQAVDNIEIRCPKCGSSAFDMVSRKYSLFTGFKTNKVDRVCRNCKHKF
ncbi:zinc-ribbon domain-containing protein [Anaerocolumna xylanovorans]|uniref:Zinc-ribbon domain-containing protein n=1 Tax=Anaerocolumna xylanovorans DSM 12503 TaxID=1121345 RepID=A0A1M7YDA4_9FIRM|nr:zinc-ribbon domain-containing protein [Anaerocolumna xylanovorans]SHO50614.1 zinc-ribbon domain-containing protein [Anaerocolumna xylanovorans DSM 12503]